MPSEASVPFGNALHRKLTVGAKTSADSVRPEQLIPAIVAWPPLSDPTLMQLSPAEIAQSRTMAKESADMLTEAAWIAVAVLLTSADTVELSTASKH